VNEQVRELRRIFGQDVCITTQNVQILDAQHLRDVILEATPDVVEVVLPIELIGALLDDPQVCVPIIRAVMRRKLTKKSAVFTFDHYEQMRRIHIDTEDLRKKEVSY